MNRSRTITLTLSACFRQKQLSNSILPGTRVRSRSCSSSSVMPPFSYCRPQTSITPSEQCFIEEAMASPRGRTRVCFAVHVENILPDEFVMVAGSCEELGKWDPQSAITLTQDAENPTRWMGYVMTNDQSLSFRYFLAYKLSGELGERLIISRWESFLHPRSVLVPAEQRNGVCRSMQVDLFGYYAGQRLLSDGWLQHSDEYQILLRIHGKALKFFKTSKDRSNCRIRITPLDVRKKHGLVKGISILKNDQEAESCVDEEDDDEDTGTGVSPYPTHSSTDIAVLSDTSPRFRRQTCTGAVFNNNKDYLVFKTHSVAVDFLAFYVEVFSEEQKRIGACYALPGSLSDSFGATQLPFINSSGRPIGQISIEYLFVRSLQKTVPYQTMEKSFSRYWKKRTTLEVGHRGAGSSYTKLAMTRENTVQSLNTAAKNGADFVEFDVQLTKDKVAVIYHDFHVLVSVAKRGVNSSRMDEGVDYHEIAIKDLKLNQLKLLNLDHVSKREANSRTEIEEKDEGDDLKPFPTLVETLNKVDKDVGFNVEVKYPMMQTNGEHECDHYFERNEFVDIILADILNHANGRRIMFSSFDPDICSLISIKQNKYPVLFLCVGETTRYTPFSDQRTSTSLTAVNFAAGADILGVNFNSEDLLKDPFPVQRASEFGLVSFVWGDDLDKKETLNYFKRELGVDGLIYDRIGEEEGRRNVFLVEREQKRAIFLASSGHSTPRAPSPVDSVSSTSSNFSEVVSPKRVDMPQLDLEINKINIHNQSPRVQITQS
ncbi:unnamed protein product [Auanema sp. JU1783]|nr:unnamed protein product [Auanema sp. JU1783]